MSKKLLIVIIVLATVVLLILIMSNLSNNKAFEQTKMMPDNETVITDTLIEKQPKNIAQKKVVTPKNEDDIEETTWKNKSNLIKFTSERGGYMQHSGKKNKEVFTYSYDDGAGHISSEYDYIHFIVEKDTLTMQGADYIRQRN